MNYPFSSVAAEDASQQAVKELMPLDDQHVLIVDSALATRRVLQDQLLKLGAKSVVFASSVHEVQAHLLSKEFALLICEFQLEGERNGQQLLEELRVNHTLKWSTAFMMLTGERSYSKVVSVAEFEPDDYLIKPFSGAELVGRVVRVFNRKTRLEPVYKAFYMQMYDEVPMLCAALTDEFPEYHQELQRLQIESLYRSGLWDQAKDELLCAMELSAKPWMRFLMAKMYVERSCFDEASDLLQSLVRSNPEYMAAVDLFADVLWEQDMPHDALDVLEKMGLKALDSTRRLRKLASLSVRIGDVMRSKQYLTRAIERSYNTSLFHIHDFLLLSKIYMEEGRYEEADKLTVRLRNSASSNELELALSMMSIQKDIADERHDRAIEKLDALFRKHSSVLDQLAPDILTCLLEVCFAVRRQDKGYELVPYISKKTPNKAMLDRIRSAIERCKHDIVDNQPPPKATESLTME